MDKPQAAANRVTRLLRDAARSGTEPMGFANRASAAAAPAIVIIESGRAGDSAGRAAIAVSLGTDTIEAADRGATPVIARIISGLVDAAVRERAARADIDLLAVELGAVTFDGLSSTGGTSIAVVVDATPDALPPSRALGELPVEVFLVRRRSPSVNRWTGSDLLAMRQIADTVRQWVVAIADAGSRPADLQTLRDAGIVGVIVDAGADIAAWQSAAAGVRVRRPTARGDSSAILPRAPSGQAAPADDDDDDGDDDDQASNRTDA
ncbi:MAG: hypothetical protein EPO26_00500 [Chloroflexota bacterium]|nr:MAG: hypothetical protein EPO26_00500 [Chloroflexota bacterium]